MPALRAPQRARRPPPEVADGRVRQRQWRRAGLAALLAGARTCGGLHERLQIRVLCHEVPHPAGRVLAFGEPGRAGGQPLQVDGRHHMRAGDEPVCSRL